jgi:hypothetical protein
MNKAKLKALNLAIESVTLSRLETRSKQRVIDILKRLKAEDPVYQAIRDFEPTSDQRPGYEALVAWLESVTPFRLREEAANDDQVDQ